MLLINNIKLIFEIYFLCWTNQISLLTISYVIDILNNSLSSTWKFTIVADWILTFLYTILSYSNLNCLDKHQILIRRYILFHVYLFQLIYILSHNCMRYEVMLISAVTHWRLELLLLRSIKFVCVYNAHILCSLFCCIWAWTVADIIHMYVFRRQQ